MRSRSFIYKDALSEAELRQIAAMDFVRDVMLVVTTEGENHEIVIGSGSYNAFEDADGVFCAEVAFVVEEDYQGCGIASRLLAHLAKIAREQGVVRFDADVLPKNHAMLGVFARSGLPMHRQIDRDVVHVSMALLAAQR